MNPHINHVSLSVDIQYVLFWRLQGGNSPSSCAMRAWLIAGGCIARRQWQHGLQCEDRPVHPKQQPCLLGTRMCADDGVRGGLPAPGRDGRVSGFHFGAQSR